MKLINETFNGRKLEFMLAIIFIAACTILLLYGNSHVLSDTSPTSIALKIKKNEILPLWIYCVY